MSTVPWTVTFPGGWTATVDADDEREAKCKALESLVRRGHSLDPKIDVTAAKIVAIKRT